MAKKKSLFKSKKEIEKTLTDSLFDSVAAAAGAVGASFGYNTVKDKLPPKILGFGGAIVAITGTALSVTANDSKIVALGHGITASGAFQLLSDKASPKIKAKLGMHGLGELGKAEEIPTELLNQIANQIETEEQEYQDIDNPEDIQGVDEEGNYVDEPVLAGDAKEEDYSEIVDML